jgi:hypothetical protein
MPAALFVKIAVSCAAITTVRSGHLITNDRANDSADYGAFSLVATSGDYIPQYAACASPNHCTNDTATSVTATTVILRKSDRRGENSKRKACEKYPTFHKIFFSRNWFVKA